MFPKRSKFNLDHTRKQTMSMGKLVPMMCMEVVPGDTFKVSSNVLVRLAPMLAPVMGELTAFVHYWYVPTRLLQKNWDSFLTHGVDGVTVAPRPTIAPPSGGWPAGSLADYLGIPPENTSIPVLAYPFRAYALIYNEWYRDENLITPVGFSDGDGVDTATNTSLLDRCWQRDYFTNALPWPQRGPAVTLPIGSKAPVYGNGNPIRYTDIGGYNNNTAGQTLRVGPDPQDTTANHVLSNINHASDPLYWPKSYSSSYADLSNATSSTINDIRMAFQLQKWAEKNARGGVRLIEYIFNHFGVRVSDSRLQRPEFLGGGRAPIIISEVLQTSSTDSTTPQANPAGTGFSAQRTPSFTKSFEEHGYIIGLISIMPKTSYQQGIPRKFLRETSEDFYTPVFANLGEQAITIKELYAGATDPDKIFGFTPRYQEYRTEFSSVHGDFRTNMNFWHFGRIFANEPTLSAQFVKSDPTTRVFAVTTGNYPPCWCHIGNNVTAIRPIPKQGIPGFIDHDGWFAR